MLWNFFFVSMENILQSLVKIIIIGSVYKTTTVDCNRQFLPPPLPYYPNGNFFIPSYAAPYHEPLPIYYREENPLPPISFQNMNALNPPQLFHRNENYNPLPLTNPVVRYTPPQMYQYKSDFHQPHKSNGVPQFDIKKAQVPAEPQNRPTEAPPKKKPAFYGANIIIKEETQLPYYSDDYSKNYHDEDYSDNYSDESPSKPDPCVLNSPYRYFEPPKPDSNNPNGEDKYTLCSSYFQPNFGNSVYTVKMPITLLPSRFPPRIEQLIERIQNYFSTYTQQEATKPQNQTSNPQPAIVESVQVNATTESLNKKNSTEETIVEPTNPSEAVTTVGGSEPVVAQPDVIPSVQQEKEPQGFNQSLNQSTGTVPTPTEALVQPVNEQQHFVLETQAPVEDNTLSDIQSPPEINIQMMNISTTGRTVEMNNGTEETFTLKDGLLQLNVTDSYS